MKKVIRLTESKLNNIVLESVKRVLTEAETYFDNSTNEDPLVSLISDFIHSYKNYRFDSPLKYNVNKVFNHGMGSLSLFRFDNKSDTVFVNSVIANSKDMERLNNFLNTNGMEDWHIQKKEYGCPDWYNHNF